MSKFPENTNFRTSEQFSERLVLIKDDNDCTTNKQFAELVGVSEPVIAKAINFNIVPTLRMLIRIADKLELSLNYLLGIDEVNNFICSAKPSDFYKRLIELAEENKINFAQIATKNGFPRTYIYEWMSNGTLPAIDYLLSMAKFFNVSPDYLLGRTDYKK